MRNLFVIIAFIVTLLCLPQVVHSVNEGVIDAVQAAIQQLSPRVSDNRARELAGYITRHSIDSDIDPLLVTSITMRESSFSFALQTGKRVGRAPQKCVGLMQIYPYGAAHKLAGYLNLANADTNIRTGVMWLEYVRGSCGATHWQWIAGYGMSKCPNLRDARTDDAAIVARRYYCQIQEDCDEIWPRWEKTNEDGHIWLRNQRRLFGPDPSR